MLRLLVALLLLQDSPTPPAPPRQPEKGPGGKDYAHAKVAESSYGEKAQKFWIFEPDEPRPEKAPLVVFNHGWGAMVPGPYRAWIDHIVRRGGVVVYPAYQGSLAEPPGKFTPNAVGAVRAAIEELKKEGRVRPDLEKFAIVGHSAGGVVSANMAATWEDGKLPKPRAVMVVQPGGGTKRARMGIPYADFSRIPESTLLLALAGEDDTIVGTEPAKLIYRESTGVPKENRNYILFRTDRHGAPPLSSDHFSPCTIGRRGADAVDWLGYWKLFDALCDAAFHGRNRDSALGNTDAQKSLGQWSDGTAVRPLEVVDDPAKLDE